MTPGVTSSHLGASRALLRPPVVRLLTHYPHLPLKSSDDRTLRDKRVTEMIRLLRLRHAGAGYRLDAVRSHPGAARTLDHQAGPGPWKLPPSWSFATAQVRLMFLTWRSLQRQQACSKPRLAYERRREDMRRVS